jgi:hypothetical protein
MALLELLIGRRLANREAGSGGWKPKSRYCGISSMSCSSAHHADCICVGPTAPCSFGSIVAVLAFLTP